MPRWYRFPWLRRIAASANLWAAWRVVRRRRGGAGIDDVTISAFQAREAHHLRRIEHTLLDQTYTPRPLKRVRLDKGHGQTRDIGVPCIADRIVQHAMHRVLSPHFEQTFCECSYGFRVGRSAHQAIHVIVDALQRGATWVAETDIESFFDMLDWQLLRTTLAESLLDDAVLDLIHRFLQIGLLHEAVAAQKGVPQGTGCSPLFANVYLTPFDHWMAAQGGQFVRYGDDMLSLHGSRRAAKASLISMRQYLEGRLRLRLHPGKTHLTNTQTHMFEFLGFCFANKRAVPTHEALLRFRSRIHALVQHTEGQPLRQRLEAVNPIVRGWGEYYKVGDVDDLFGELDAWILKALQLPRQHRKSLASLIQIKHRYEVKRTRDLT